MLKFYVTYDVVFCTFQGHCNYLRDHGTEQIMSNFIRLSASERDYVPKGG